MKYFIRVFLLCTIIFSLISSSLVYKTYSSIKTKNENYKPNYIEDWYDASDFSNADFHNELINSINSSHRINFLVLGLEELRTDTIMFVSFDEKTKDLDIISIPRDTYYYKEGFRSGFEDATNYKINAIYCTEGPEGVEQAVEDLLNVPIDYYVTITYKGVADIVDAIGGVEIDVPFDMYYKDDWDDPPLLIDIKAGPQILYGEKAVGFLRFRKNKEETINYGDIGRIKLQQKFIASAIKKSLSFKLPKVIKEVFNCVKTNISVLEILSYADSAFGMNMDNVNMLTAPGDSYYKDRISFYRIDIEKMHSIICDLYNVKKDISN